MSRLYSKLALFPPSRRNNFRHSGCQYVWHVLCIDCAYKPKFLGQNLHWSCRASALSKDKGMPQENDSKHGGRSKELGIPPVRRLYLQRLLKLLIFSSTCNMT
jgi:hypothetical protein